MYTANNAVMGASTLGKLITWGAVRVYARVCTWVRLAWAESSWRERRVTSNYREETKELQTQLDLECVGLKH